MTQPPNGGYHPPQEPGGQPGGLYGTQREPYEPTQQFGAAPTTPGGYPSQPGHPQPGYAGYPQSSPPSAGYPQSAPPAAGYPQSGPPAAGEPAGYAPSSAVPGQYAPASGQPFGPPMSGPPGYPPPAGGATGSGGRGRAVLVLALVAGLLFVLGGVMTGLYLNTSGDLERTEQTLATRTTERDDRVKEIEKLKTELQTAKDKLSDTQQDLTGTKNDRDEQARQKKVIASCLEKLTAALTAAAAGNKAAYDQATKGLDAICNEAEKYL